MNYLFPLTYLANGLATTFLLIGLGLAGKSVLAADVGLVQGATLATFFAFSGNARSLILHAKGSAHLPGILGTRLLLALPLSAVALILGVTVGGVAPVLALALVLRRCGESFSEVHLSLIEREDRPEAALNYLLLQALTLVLALVWALAQWESWILIWYVWAIVPALSAFPVLRKIEWLRGAELRRALPELFPHFGSTAIIGISIYAFRLLVLLLGGRVLAGDLYTAFALGSFVGSVFANVLGPSLLWHQTRTGQRSGSWLHRGVLPAMVLLGAAILLLAVNLHGATLLGRPPAFWEAMGLSLMGGAVMLVAQRLRLGLLQDAAGSSVFGADMMINLLLLVAVPLCYTLFGADGLTGLYALNAALCLVFYLSARGLGDRRGRAAGSRREPLLAGIAGLLLLPLFVQLGEGIYRHTEPLLDSGGGLLTVPLPVSILATILGILALGRFRRAQLSLAVLFLLFLTMLLATIISTHGELQAEERKLVLLLQFLVPVFGLVLGEMVGPKDWRAAAMGFVVCLWAIVPWQLAATWFHGQLLLSHDLSLFGIYQHRQYVPVVLVSAYIVALFALCRDASWRYPVLALAPLVAVYAVASTSILAITTLVLGYLAWARHGASPREALPAAALLVLLGLAYFALAIRHPDFSAKFAYLGENAPGLLPDSFQARIGVWGDYFRSIASNVSTIAFGHARPPERWLSTGAHNYYLDLVYHFGVFALLPLLFLTWHTIAALWVARAKLYGRPAWIGLALVVLLLLAADNNWKVAFRQPYSGLMGFFLWGMLLAGIRRLRAAAPEQRKVDAGVVSHAH